MKSSKYTNNSFIHSFLKLAGTGLTDRLDDLIVGFYGLVGLVVLYMFREELLNYRKAFPFLVAGFILLFAMVFMDLLTNRKDVLYFLLQNHHEFANRLHSWLTVFEDTFKIYGEVAFLGMFHSCLTVAKKLASKSSAVNDAAT